MIAAVALETARNTSAVALPINRVLIKPGPWLTRAPCSRATGIFPMGAAPPVLARLCFGQDGQGMTQSRVPTSSRIFVLAGDSKVNEQEPCLKRIRARYFP